MGEAVEAPVQAAATGNPRRGVRYAILGDIHGNLEALEAALRKLRTIGVDRYVQVGDIVGYGADPGPCIQAMRDIDAVAVAGNHDWAVIGKLDDAFFNRFAKAAIEWTRSVMSADDRHYLEQLPLHQRVDDDVEVVHASLDQPELFDYIQDYHAVQRCMRLMSAAICFNGHSHVPITFTMDKTPAHTMSTSIVFPKGARALVNVGSIGQPRDDDPRCACAVFDSETRRYELLRVEYDVKTAAEKIRRSGLPGALADRLLIGY